MRLLYVLAPLVLLVSCKPFDDSRPQYDIDKYCEGAIQKAEYPTTTQCQKAEEHARGKINDNWSRYDKKAKLSCKKMLNNYVYDLHCLETEQAALEKK